MSTSFNTKDETGHYGDAGHILEETKTSDLFIYKE